MRRTTRSVIPTWTASRLPSTSEHARLQHAAHLIPHRESNTISVYNSGRGIPIAMHAKEQVYVPELIFGHLLTSSNYDDDEKKVSNVVFRGLSRLTWRFVCCPGILSVHPRVSMQHLFFFLSHRAIVWLTQVQVTGGRNGYGAKLCNIFSTEFTVETADK